MDKQIISQQEIEAIVDGLTLFDDDLMSKCFDGNIPATEYLLRVILNRDDIHVVSVKGQAELKNPIVGGRNIRLDILVEDDAGVQFNVEVQRSNAGAHPRRVRFHSSMVDARMLRAKQDFKELRDSYVIFITEKDYFKMGKPMYTVKKYIDGSNEEFNDGAHIIYVNGAYQGNDDIGKLIHDFHCKHADEIYSPALAGSVRHFKEEGGRLEMCEAVQKYAEKKEKQGEIRGAINMAIGIGADKSTIVEQLQSRFNITEEDAVKAYEDYMAQDV